MKREWYFRCSVCGGYQHGGVDILSPCPYCGQVANWIRVFEVEHTEDDR